MGRGCQHSGISGLVLSWGRHRAGQAGQQGERIHLKSVRAIGPRTLQGQADSVIWQDGETFLCKRRTQDVAQEAGAGFVVEGTSVSLGVYIEPVVQTGPLPSEARGRSRFRHACGCRSGCLPSLVPRLSGLPANGQARRIGPSWPLFPTESEDSSWVRGSGAFLSIVLRLI